MHQTPSRLESASRVKLERSQVLKHGAVSWFLGLCTCAIFYITYFPIYYIYILITDKNHYTFSEIAMAFLVSWAVSFAVLSFQISLCLVPTAPIQTLSTGLVYGRPSVVRFSATGLLTALSALGTAYLYDYGVPPFRWYTDDNPDWVHGLTLRLYATAFLVQSVILIVACALPFITSGFRRFRQKHDDNACGPASFT